MGKLFDAITSKGLPERDIKNAVRANLWIMAWAAVLVISTSFINADGGNSIIIAVAATVAITFIGIGMILLYRKMLRELDEMERKVQLDALALSVGTTLVGFGSYSILAKVGVLPDLKAAYGIACMGLVYMAGLIIGRVRYS